MTKKSKMLLALLLVLVALFAAACGGDGELKLPAGVNGETGSDSGNGSAEQSGGNAAQEVTIAESVLYEAENVKVTVKGLDKSIFGTQIKVMIENNSEKDVLVTSQSVSVNGYMMPGASLYSEVAAGKKANDNILLLNSELEQSGIQTIANMQLYLELQDPETWETKATSDLLTVSTSAGDFEQPVDDSGNLLYDENGIKIVCKGLKKDVIWDGTVVFYMENNSGKEISIHSENVSVNGFMQDVALWSNLRPGTKLIDGMSMINLSDLEIEDINQIENIEFNLRIVDADSWEEIVTTDTLTLEFN